MTHFQEIIKKIPADVKLVVVTKTVPPEVIMDVYNAGHRRFGENKAQQLIARHPVLPPDIQWHFIGHLQTNKVRFIAPFVSMIESVDSFKLLKEINKEADKCGRSIPCLLQFHIAEEETKYGLDLQEAAAILESADFKALKNVSLRGVMGMATFTDDMDQVRTEFRKLKLIFNTLKERNFAGDPGFREISMGMSGDYEVAIEEGSTIVRIGSAIFS